MPRGYIALNEKEERKSSKGKTGAWIWGAHSRKQGGKEASCALKTRLEKTAAGRSEVQGGPAVLARGKTATGKKKGRRENPPMRLGEAQCAHEPRIVGKFRLIVRMWFDWKGGQGSIIYGRRGT